MYYTYRPPKIIRATKLSSLDLYVSELFTNILDINKYIRIYYTYMSPKIIENLKYQV